MEQGHWPVYRSGVYYDFCLLDPSCWCNISPKRCHCISNKTNVSYNFELMFGRYTCQSLGSKPVGVDLRCNRFQPSYSFYGGVICTPPPTLSSCPGLWLAQVPFLVPAARFRSVHEAEISIQISALAGDWTSKPGVVWESVRHDKPSGVVLESVRHDNPSGPAHVRC